MLWIVELIFMVQFLYILSIMRRADYQRLQEVFLQDFVVLLLFFLANFFFEFKLLPVCIGIWLC